jgi:hypothetical protein
VRKTRVVHYLLAQHPSILHSSYQTYNLLKRRFQSRWYFGHPVKGATLIGSGDEALKKISMVANDLKLDSGVGVCGKDGQSVPVGVGQPSLKIDELTVRGTRLRWLRTQTYLR